MTDTGTTLEPTTRRRRGPVLLGLGIVVVLLLAVALPLFQPWKLVTDDVVDEALPVAASPRSTASASAAAPTTAGATTTGATTTAASPGSPSAAPAGRQGTLVSHEHATSGVVRLLTLADGSTVLRIEGLDTSNGPDLHVWLSDQPVVDGPSGWTVFDDGAYVDLGALKGNKGSQNYAVPAGTDLSAFRSVSIWCARFRVSFGAASQAA